MILKQNSFRRKKYRWQDEAKAKNNICSCNKILIKNLIANHSETHWVFIHKKSNQ